MRELLAATFDLMLEFNRAVSLADVHSVILAHAEVHGVTALLAGIIPERIVKPADQPRYVVLGHWPEEWAQRYFHKQYVVRDPTIHHCAVGIEPLFWSDIEYNDFASPAKRIMDEARDFRLKDGLTIPQLTIDGHRIGVSFSGERIDRSPEALTRLTVLAAYGVTRALQLRAMADLPTIRLTPRERECLQWAAEGKTSHDIADILGITFRVVEKHLAAARYRLGALNTIQATAQALRLGLI